MKKYEPMCRVAASLKMKILSKSNLPILDEIHLIKVHNNSMNLEISYLSYYSHCFNKDIGNTIKHILKDLVLVTHRYNLELVISHQ